MIGMCVWNVELTWIHGILWKINMQNKMKRKFIANDTKEVLWWEKPSATATFHMNGWM